jgi:hypothetical protein
LEIVPFTLIAAAMTSPIIKDNKMACLPRPLPVYSSCWPS